jgi:hypothetical protein
LAGAAANCLGLVNQRYFRSGWCDGLEAVEKLPEVPEDIRETLRGVMSPGSADRGMAYADRLVLGVRAVLLAAQASLPEPHDVRETLRDIYFFIVEYTGKIKAACEKKDALGACGAAFALQAELSQRMNEAVCGSWPTEFNMLCESWRAYRESGLPDLLRPAIDGNVGELAEQAGRLQEQARRWFEDHGIATNILCGEEQLRVFLCQRGQP